MQSDTQAEQERRWKSEAGYFDGMAYDTGPLDAAVVNRYLKCAHPYLITEYEFVALGDLTGKTVLEVGCGDGWRSIMMAMRGARVVGVDLSEAAISAARTRAARHGLESRIQFHVSPLELFHTDERFDVITAFAMLHHLIPVLESTLKQLKMLGKPGARFFFSEPVAPSRLLRKARLMLPIAVNGTDDERPLESSEYDIIKRRFPGAKFTHFNAFTRVCSRLLHGPLEKAPRWFQHMYFAAGRADQLILQQLGLNRLGSIAFIEAQI